jgi:hypothetical protein
MRKLLPRPVTPAVELGPERVEPPPPAPLAPPASARTEPLAPERYKVQFTASRQLRDKLERLQALLGEDLAAVIEAAVTEKLERLEAKRYAQTKSREKSSKSQIPRPGHGISRRR